MIAAVSASTSPHQTRAGSNGRSLAEQEYGDSHSHSHTFPVAKNNNNRHSSDLSSPHLSYGSTSIAAPLDTPGYPRSAHSSPERFRRESGIVLDRVPENNTMEFDHESADARYVGVVDYGDSDQEETELDDELEVQGLYRGACGATVSFSLSLIVLQGPIIVYSPFTRCRP